MTTRYYRIRTATINATFILLMIFLAVPVQVYAYGGVQGQVIDSKNKDPWQYGGEVWVYVVSTGDVCATGRLNPTDGTFNLALNGTDDVLGYGTTADCTTGAFAGQTIEILIDFTCSFKGSYGGSTCNPPSGYPATAQVQFTQNALPITYNAGYIETGTGPTAVTLESFSGTTVTPSNRLVAVAAGLLGVAVMALTAITLRAGRRR